MTAVSFASPSFVLARNCGARVLLPVRAVPGCDAALPTWLPPRWRRRALFAPGRGRCGVFRPSFAGLASLAGLASAAS